MTAAPSINHVFLDLDGTLTDPKQGITLSVTYALQQMGLEAPDPDTLGWVIGSALVKSFAELGVRDVQAALEHYRRRFSDVGIYENRPYAGVEEMLGTLQAEGRRLCLVTAKPHVYVRRITEHFGLAPYLVHEFGPELDGTRNDKADLLAHALETTGADPERAVMVGDRMYDFAAAQANGVRSIAVTWGYGDESEWALADYRCDAMQDLPALIGNL